MLEIDKNKMRFYPIVDNFEWVRKLIQWGAKSIQLRIKINNNVPNNYEAGVYLENQIKSSIEYCKKHQCQLFINDYWELALKYKAFGIHLGYEDSHQADLMALQNAKINLGLSTHDYNELNFALKLNPSYIALGPIFPTQTKIMRFAPQGISRITEWRNLIPANIPLVAIGGISLEHGFSIYSAGADSISVISDFKSSQHPEGRVKNWIQIGECL
ncbi:thiamine phosphate synthase [Fluviispira sanaruensis]|uniref:Thiamine phosphate synthase n=1 Tax=Fluviispira sanaruensis TaxID=2493639 RepID=A0A4P2VMX8_FLUSA|nr:thiamine phosphate synthase [Fluviispira sanaruensis]BBH54361.1 thiamine phosphate synthase [Fluviispira sanaruensis]